MQKQIVFFRLILIGAIFLLSHCKKESETTISPPTSSDLENWINKANEDIEALEVIVQSVEKEDVIESYEFSEDAVDLKFLDGGTARILLDNANYPSPLVGAHFIDKRYYWTIINGTGTSSVRLLKDKNRQSYPVGKGISPEFTINNKGVWAVNIEGVQEELFDTDGAPFRAIGRKSLFNAITFDIDSNATITTNESSGKSYFINRYRPFTLLLGRSEKDTLTVASGFTIPLDFQQVGIHDIEFEVPNAWQVDYELDGGQKKGLLQITSPTGMEPDFGERGSIIIRAKDQYNRVIVRKIPVKVEVGVVNYASVNLANVVSGVDITGARFTFAENITSTNIKEVTAIKAGASFRLMIPDGFPQLRKATFTTATAANFDYYFEPNTFLVIGEQNLSIAAPKLLTYWQGGMIVKINQTLPLSGIASYQISGKVVHIKADANVLWFPNGSTNVSGANSDTDGVANTQAIINALGGVGTSANYIARWAIRVRNGGYSDWYLGALKDYEYFHSCWSPNTNGAKDIMNQNIARLGGDITLRETHNLFWTSTNISATHAKTYDVRESASSPWLTGQKIYAARGLAFRDFN